MITYICGSMIKYSQFPNEFLKELNALMKDGDEILLGDSDFDHQPYIMKAPADETPININDVLAFIDRHHFEPSKIRKTVEHLSWKAQMKIVIDHVFSK